MTMKLLLLCLVGLTMAGDYEREFEEFTKATRGKKMTWKAGLNPYFMGMEKENILYHCGRVRKNITRLPALSVKALPRAALPKSFDSRQKWPYCKMIGLIRDQANCGSCWAVSSASAISDRICIASEGFAYPYISAQHLMTCCRPFCGDGCEGGDEDLAFLYWIQHGLVTGAPWGSTEACQPYEIYPCRPHCDGLADTPKCRTTCIKEYNIPYDRDLFKGKSRVLMHDELSMMTELYQHGPIVTAFDVYADFKFYRGGVYQHTWGAYRAGHAVKVIGWGEENGVPYWLGTNSWNVTWGIDGFFKMKRGTNECNFESDAVGGQPQPYEENFQ